MEWVSPNDMFKGEGIAKEKLTHTSTLEQQSTTTKHSLIYYLFSHTLDRQRIQIMHQHENLQSKLRRQTKVYSQHQGLSSFKKPRK